MSAVDLTPDSTLADVVDAAPGTARLLEADTHSHVHEENNHLFPAAVDAERRLVDRS